MKKLVISLLGLCAAACSNIDSDQLEVGQMYFSMALKNRTSAGWECYTRVSKENTNGSNVILVDGDKLMCNGVRMRGSSSVVGNYQYYTASVPLKSDNTYRITFFRYGTEYTSSSVQPPEKIEVSTPTSGFSLRSQDPLTVVFKPTVDGTETSARISFSEIDENKKTNSYSVLSRSLSKEGIIILPSFSSVYATLPNKDLPAILELSRWKKGTVGSHINGHFDAVESLVIDGTFLGKP